MNNKTMQVFIKKVAQHIASKEFRERPNYVRPPFVFWGPAGSGKTKGVEQAGTALFYPVINIRLGQEPPEDMSYPKIKTDETREEWLGKIVAEMFPVTLKGANGKVINRREVVDGEIIETDEPALNIERLKAYVENYEVLKEHYENLGLSINDAPGTILFLDEVNRIEDKQMFQMIFQLFDSGKFKGYELPANISTFGACNPSKGYIVANWFEDPAFANRCVHFKTKYSLESWLDFAKRPGSGYTETTIAMYETYPEALFDPKDNDFDIPSVHHSFRGPAFLDNYVGHIEWDEDEKSIETEVIAAILGDVFVGHYYKVVDKVAEKALDPMEIITGYDEYDMGPNPYKELSDGSVVVDTLFDAENTQVPVGKARIKFLENIDAGRTDYLKQVTDNLSRYILDNIQNPEFEETFDKNRLRFARFLLDLPKGNYGLFMKSIVAPSGTSDGRSTVVTKMLALSMNYPTEGKVISSIVTRNEKEARDAVNSSAS